MEPYITKVSEEICYSIEKELESNEYLSNMAKHIRNNNPTIAGFIVSLSDKLPTCCRNAAMLSAFTTYRLIESQMEADSMNRNIKL